MNKINLKEQENIEFKESWHDEYIKWICGFANAQGGKLYIGINDAGDIIGIKESKKLLEDIPNKIKDILGIIVDINLLNDSGKEYLEIVVESYSYPVNYKGQYFYRSGSTKQELKGHALDSFLLRKQGKTWDGVPVPNVDKNELNNKTFDYFRHKAEKSKRIDSDVLNESNSILIQKLNLLEKDYIKRAGILLFHNDPEKYITGAYVKIGYFETDDNLIYQDNIHGNLFEQVEKCMELLLTKYQKAIISYEGISRIENYPFPELAIREALINAIVHKDYGSCNPIQISVYNDKIIFWNQGHLPQDWTVKQLFEKHPSIPYNPVIAGAFFWAGLIEAWGRGTLKIINECKKAELVTPVFKYEMSGFSVELYRQMSEEMSADYDGLATDYDGLNIEEQKIIQYILKNKKITTKETKNILNVGDTKAKELFNNLINMNIIKRQNKGRNTYYIIKKIGKS